MASPQVNYKIERATEAIEGLAVAVAAARGRQMLDVSDARQELREALAEFLAPTLRVVGNED